jgi:DNA-binding response OmpR family regulator
MPTNIKIIIVQEEEAEMAELKSALEAAGYAVSAASGGAVALEMVKKQFFDILLVDYKLPDMNGIDFIKQAVAASRDSVPVIITGLSSLEIAVESMRIGAHDFLVKPVNIDELKKNIKSIISEREDLKKGKASLGEVMKQLQVVESDMVVVASQETENPGFLTRLSKLGVLRPFIAVFKLFKKYFWEID